MQADRAGWESTIKRMIAKGAKLDKAQVEPILGYLSAKSSFETKCNGCHDLRDARSRRSRTPSSGRPPLQRMAAMKPGPHHRRRRRRDHPVPLAGDAGQAEPGRARPEVGPRKGRPPRWRSWCPLASAVAPRVVRREEPLRGAARRALRRVPRLSRLRLPRQRAAARGRDRLPRRPPRARPARDRVQGRRRPPARRRHLDARRRPAAAKEPLDESPFRQVAAAHQGTRRGAAPEDRAPLPRARRRVPVRLRPRRRLSLRRRRPPRPPARGGLAADRPLRRGPDPPRDARPGDSRVLGERPPARRACSTSASSPSSASTSCSPAGGSPRPSARAWSWTARRSSG